MPIQINLLAEAQAAEDSRRRDPVKRALWGASSLVGLVLLWSLWSQVQIMWANSELSRHKARWTSIEKAHTEVTENLKASAEIDRKLAALDRLSTNRFLLGSALNALQQTMVDQVQAMRLKTTQVYTYIEPVAAKKTTTKKVPAKPAEAIEKTTISIEARDWNPENQNYNKFKESIAKFSYFKAAMAQADSLRLTSLSKPSFEPADPLRPFVTFTLEMHYPEIRRNE